MSRTDGESKTRRQSPPWFKCFPADYLEGTRQLTAEQRGLYFDFLCLMYKNDGPIPDDDRWVSFQMHVHKRTWQAAKKVLIKAGKLLLEDGLLVNERASKEVVTRRLQRDEISDAASVRESKKRDKAKKLNGNNDGGPPPCHDGGTGVARNEHGRGTTRAGASGRKISDSEVRGENREVDSVGVHHQPQVLIKKEKAHLNFSPSADDDDRPEPVRSISPSIVAALKAHAGDERGGELLREYMASDYAKNARLLDKAFIAWLIKTYGVVISGAGGAVPSRGEILDLCPKDEHGRPITTLPKVVTPMNGAVQRVLGPMTRRLSGGRH